MTPRDLPLAASSRRLSLRRNLFLSRPDDVAREARTALAQLRKDGDPARNARAHALQYFADVLVDVRSASSGAALLVEASGLREDVPDDDVLDAELALTSAKLDWLELRSIACRESLARLVASTEGRPDLAWVRTRALRYRGLRAMLRGDFEDAASDIEGALACLPDAEPEAPLWRLELLLARAEVTAARRQLVAAEVAADVALSFASARFWGDTDVIGHARATHALVTASCRRLAHPAPLSPV